MRLDTRYLSELRAYARRDWASPAHAIAEARNNEPISDSTWAGCTMREGLRRAVEGEMTLAAASDAMLEHLQPHIETRRKANVYDVAGYMPDVPRVLAGADPRVMRRRQYLPNEMAPVRVYVDMAVLADVQPSDYTRRGSAVLALVRRLAMSRPVELYACSLFGADGRPARGGGCIFTVRMPTAPLDVGVCAAWLSHPGVYRSVFLRHSGRGPWKDGSGKPTGEEDVATVKEYLGLGPRDVYLCGSRSTSRVIREPMAWMQETLAIIEKSEDE